MRHWRPHTGWAVEHRRPDAEASGENEKKTAGKFTFLTGFFLHFHCARGLSFRFPKLHAERRMEKQTSASQNGSRGDTPGAVGVQGAAQAPAFVSQATCEKQYVDDMLPIAERVQGGSPCRGGYRGRGAPCFVTVSVQNDRRCIDSRPSPGCRYRYGCIGSPGLCTGWRKGCFP